jgi:hypothetical protein
VCMLIPGIATPEEWQREIAARDQRRPFDKSTAGGPIAARSITRRPVNRTARSSLHPVQTGPTARLPLLRKRPPSRQLSYLFQPSFGPVRIERSIADNLLLPIPYPMHNNAVSTPKCFSRRNYTELQYRVLIDDNAHYMDESEHAARGVFGSATFAR